MRKLYTLFLFVFIMSVLIFTGPSAALARDVQLSFGGSATGGVMFYIAGAFTNTVSPLVDGVNVTNVTTGAAVDNIIRVARGELDLAITYGALVYEMAHGTGIFESPEWAEIAHNVMGISKAYDSDISFTVLARSDIMTLSDLNGRTVSMGPPGSGTQYAADMIADALGLDITRRYLSFGDTVSAMREGVIDAMAQAGSPAGSVTELAEMDGIRIIPFTNEDIATIQQVSPFFYADYMPVGRYRGVDEPIQLPHFRNYWIVHRDVCPDLLYRMLEVTFRPDIISLLAMQHPAWNEHAEDTEGFESLGLEIHPGARRFFENHPNAPRAEPIRIAN